MSTDWKNKIKGIIAEKVSSMTDEEKLAYINSISEDEKALQQTSVDYALNVFLVHAIKEQEQMTSSMGWNKGGTDFSAALDNISIKDKRTQCLTSFDIEKNDTNDQKPKKLIYL